MITDTGIMDFTIRFANRQDTALILRFIKELAQYEQMLDLVVANEETLEEYLFEQKKAEVVIAEFEQKPVGFALFFHNFSTFLGRSGLYLEDLYVTPEMRGRGMGKAIFKWLARLAKERKCGRFEWWCLDWNESSIQFYKHLGAIPMEDWTVYRLDGEALDRLAGQ
jgi:GNAT superfamily N-acetyltransferase